MCHYAHSLRELLPPDETDEIDEGAWDECDRWYGQAMTSDQLSRIQQLYMTTPPHCIPVWAHGLRYWCMKTTLPHDNFLEWDYGLTRDVRELIFYRYGQESPFEFVEGLWAQLETRREGLAQS